jgi:hypothetical protein
MRKHLFLTNFFCYKFTLFYLLLSTLALTIKIKECKFHPKTVRDDPEREASYIYIYTLSLASVLDGVGGQHHPLEGGPVTIV